MSEELSLAERLALLSDEERDEVIADYERTGLSYEDLLYDPGFWLRPRQQAAIDSPTWITGVIAGRGFGKTLTLSEWVREQARTPATRIAIVGRTVADVRDTIINGESGVLNVHAPRERPEYTPSLRKLVWPNGSTALTFTSAEPAQLRGPSFHCAACDELAAWSHVPDDSGLTAWDNVKIATRLGKQPKIFIATTPKRHKVIRELLEEAETDERITILRGSTLDNRANLSEAYLQTLFDKYAGTALARQELLGELLDVVEGALWREDDVVLYDLEDDGPYAPLTHLVGVDPGVTTKGDATGIVVVYGTRTSDPGKRLACVVEDATEPGLDPDKWAAKVVSAAWRHAHPDGTPALVIAESNQGVELIRSVINAQDPRIRVRLVHAQVSKAARADPIVLAYRRRRVTHRPGADLDLLVDEMTSWEPGGGWSPNRMDAMVHACRALLVERAQPGTGLSISTPSAEASGAYARAVLPVIDRRGGGVAVVRFPGMAGFRP